MVSSVAFNNSRKYLSRSLVAILTILLIFEPLSTIAAQRKQSKQQTDVMSDRERIEHILARLSYGARPGDIDHIAMIGIDSYINKQLDPDSIDDSALDERLSKLPTLALATPNLLERFNPLPPKPAADATAAKADAANAQKRPDPQQVVTELQRAAFLRAVYSSRQLYEIMVEFWENHFNIFINKDVDRFLLTGFDRDAIRPFAMGRFRDLLGATTHSPAMLYYLDNWQSSVAHTYPTTNGKPARTTGGLNENYARELMELHTLGVDGGYTQKDVQEVARCFTGWTIRKPNEEGLFLFNPQMHDNGEKVVLGQRITAGGIGDGEQVLDILARHSSTAHFIATKLARHFINDNPPQEVVNRAAAVFLKTDGSIRETLRAVITSPEFFSRSVYRAKVKSPFEYAASATRALGAETDGDRPMLDWIARMGQPIFGKLTPNGYADRADEWLSTNSLLERLNFSIVLVKNEIKGTRVDPLRLLPGMEIDEPHTIAVRLIQLLLDGNVEPKTREALDKVVDLTPPAAAKGAISLQLISLVVGTPEFQRH